MTKIRTPFRQKRDDTKIGTIEKQYGINFDGVRSDKKLGNYLKEQGFLSLSKALERAEKISNKK